MEDLREKESDPIPAPDLPSGTLTFLFTDVEGSTRLWEHYPDQMRNTMIRHDALIENSVARYGGVIVRPRGEGDSRFAVFTRASEAIIAAISIQRQFSTESWAVPHSLRVRIALSAGEAELRDGDYYGSVVNRCARLRSVTYGGQILVSQTTYDLVKEALPEGVTLRDLGEYKLKDLTGTEHIYQVTAAGLPSEFPPLRTDDSTTTKLPLSLTSFIGRESEIAEVKELLSVKRALTITGPGGAGKTRLVIEVASDVLNLFPDGVWFVDLASLSNDVLVSHYVMNSLGLREEVGCSPIQTLQDFFREKDYLLILDNCEHLLQEVSQFAENLLQAAPKLKILATSREPLGVLGETIWCIPPLSSPEIFEVADIEKLSKYEAVNLFVDRAKLVRPDYSLTEQNASAVAQICSRLDGIPLAVELAAARVRVLSEIEISARLDDRFELLVGNRNLIPRQQTLRNLVDWSYDLLSEKERIFFHRLSIFNGGWTLQSAEEVCSGGSIESIEILNLLAHLVDKSLVVAEPLEGSIRYRFLETIRQYAHERLVDSYELDEIACKHADYFTKIVEQSYGELWGPNQKDWLLMLDKDHDNLRLALEWMSQDLERAEMLLRMAGSLWRFWEIRGYIREGRAWIERALETNPNAPSYLRANGMRGAGMLARQQGDYEHAKAMHEQSLALFREMGDEGKLGMARELDVLGEIAQYQGDYSLAIKLHMESLALRYEIDDKEGIAISLGQLGIIALDRGQIQQAREMLEESLKMNRELGDHLYTALSLNNLGFVAYHLCEYRLAHSLFEEAVTIYRELNDRLGVSNTLLNLGSVSKDQGELKVAKKFYKECLVMKEEIGDKRGIARVTAGLAEVTFLQGNYILAEELAEQSLTLSRNLGVKRGVIVSIILLAYIAHYQGNYDRALSFAEESLSLSADLDFPRAIAYSEEIFGLGAYAKGDLSMAIKQFQEALTAFQKINDKRSVAFTMINLARTAYRQGDHTNAMHYLEESLSIARELETRWILGFVLEIMGLIERSKGNYDQAAKLFLESLRLSLDQENLQGVADCLGALAGLAVMTSQPARAARLFAAADKLRKTNQMKMGSHDQREYERCLEKLHQQIEEKEFGTAWSQGITMTIDEIVADEFE